MFHDTEGFRIVERSPGEGGLQPLGDRSPDLGVEGADVLLGQVAGSFAVTGSEGIHDLAVLLDDLGVHEHAQIAGPVAQVESVQPVVARERLQGSIHRE